MSNTENTSIQEQLKKVIREGNPDQMQALLFEAAIESGDLTRAFAQVWAERALEAQGIGQPQNEPGKATGDTSTSRWLPDFSARQAKRDDNGSARRGVRINW